jgi:hypothetical protein
MTDRLTLNRAGARPDLDALLKWASQHVMTAAEIAAQRRSWVIGEMMVEHPEMSREKAEAIVDSVIEGSVSQPASPSPDPNQTRNDSESSLKG